MRSLNILGVKVSCVNFQQAMSQIERFIRSQKPHQVITLNPEFVITAQKDKEFKEIINKGDLVVPDGIGIVWASRLMGSPLKERVTGVELVWSLSKLASHKGYSIFFLGGREGVAKQTAFNLKKHYPKLKVAGTESGSPYDPTLIPKISSKKPTILFVAFGHPKQEKWIFKYKNRLGIPVMIGVGGAFDFISQRVKRAPVWIQKIGLEWFYRLLKQPSRWKRQLSLIQFAFLIIKESAIIFVSRVIEKFFKKPRR